MLRLETKIGMGFFVAVLLVASILSSCDFKPQVKECKEYCRQLGASSAILRGTDHCLCQFELENSCRILQ